jgi:hypothetical protein
MFLQQTIRRAAAARTVEGPEPRIARAENASVVCPSDALRLPRRFRNGPSTAHCAAQFTPVGKRFVLVKIEPDHASGCGSLPFRLSPTVPERESMPGAGPGPSG